MVYINNPLVATTTVQVHPGLTENQKEDVKRLGFGDMLSFKVDEELIHKLLGIPKVGTYLNKGVPTAEKLDSTLKSWRKRYPERFVPQTKLVEHIEIEDEVDNFHFRLDFQFLFLTMIECRAKECVLIFFTDKTDSNTISWCSYIIENTKLCKKGWRRCNYKTPFAGPLTILTLQMIGKHLLYVDKVECIEMKIDRTIKPIIFWNKKQLNCFEDTDIKDGGLVKQINSSCP
ncbi:hypothetical protein Hanom_Chr12g01137741 [Helianthus anomalus]